MDSGHAQELIRQVLPAYEVKELLGVGSFGSVFRIEDSLKERAVKIVLLSAAPSLREGRLEPASTRIERDFQHIVDNYDKIACDEIVTVYDFYKVTCERRSNHETAYAIIVMELYPANLLEYLMDYFRKFQRAVDYQTALILLEKMARLIGNLYEKRGFLFEDIKPENILIKQKDREFKLVVGDIGGLKNLGSVTIAGSQVTPAYCAAEVLRKGQKPNLRSLIFSYGMLSYFILEGHLPYDRSPVAERLDLIRERGLPFERRDITPPIAALLKRCLATEPADRYHDFTEVVEALTGRTAARPADVFADRTIEIGGSGGDPTGGETITLGEPARGLGGFRTLEQAPQGPTDGSELSMVLGNRGGHERKRAESLRVSSEKEEISAIKRQIRDMVVKRGDVQKLHDENYRVCSDILVEPDGLLSVENAKLYFEENAGIVVRGSFRAANATFGAAEIAKRWRNITLCGSDSRMSFIKQCQFRLAKGRSWETLKGPLAERPAGLEERLSYGGGLLVIGGAETRLSVTDCTFYHCQASMGGGMYGARNGGVIETCHFDSCTALIGGGGLAIAGASPNIKRCTFSTCSAGREGGGLHLVAANPTVEDCTFKGCASKSLYGGGVYLAGSSPLLRGCKFNACTSGRDGGGVYCDHRSKPKVLFPVFSGCKPTNSNCG